MSIHVPQGLPPDPEYPSPLPGPNGHTTGADLSSHQEWSGIECARTLLRRRASVGWITCLGILAAALISVVQPRLYQSQASLEIQGVLRDLDPAVLPGTDSNQFYVQTQAEMLQQDALIALVVKKLRLERRQEFQGGSSLFRQGAAPGPEQKAVEAVKKNLSIVPSQDSRIIRIVFDARDPQLAADLVNTLAQTFIEQNIEVRRQRAQQTYESLSLQLEDFRSKLLKSEAKMEAYARTSGSARGRALAAASAQQPAAGSSLTAELAHYYTLKQDVDANRQFYETMSQRVNDAGVASAIGGSNIRILGPAQPPAGPHTPNLPLNLAIGTLGGLVLAIGGVLFQEQSSSAIRAPGEAGMYLTLPELGAIPKANSQTDTVQRLLGFSHRKLRVERPAPEQELSGLSESFRATLASILSAARGGDDTHIFLVTSSRPLEGKTTVVSNLGIALAEISGKVLLIDGDMRRPRLHRVFDQSNSWGLSDVLREKNAIEELPLDVLVKKTAVPHLHLLPSGASSDNIFGLLCSGRMARLLQRFRQEFDYVLVDAPPCLEFADARIMGRYAEKLLLVVRANYTGRKTAQAAVQRLLLDGIPVLGVILNRWDPARSDIYGYAPYYRVDHQDLV